MLKMDSNPLQSGRDSCPCSAERLRISRIPGYLMSAMVLLLLVGGAAAQENVSPAESNVPVAPDPSAAAPVPGAEPAGGQLASSSEINFLQLLVQGGWFMVPLLIFSLIAATFSIERMIGLRRSRVMPQALVTALGQVGSTAGGFDPRKAYKICQQYPSSAATVVRAMLLKVGRPHSEVEHAVQEASQREAERLYSNVRWLNLAAAVSPLIGLLGTVWGMIIAFHDLTVLSPDQNKAEFLAKGIYIALVTTLGGLLVAIPSAITSHFFEGRIQAFFHQIDEMVFTVLPQVERFEGRVRFGRQAEQESDEEFAEPAPPPVSEKAPASK